MATVSIVATVQAANVPPRVKLVVTDTGTPAVNAVTVTRTDPDGRVSTVRTFDGEALRLYASGSSRVGTLYDYAMPYGGLVTYSTVEKPAASATATVPTTDVWLVHPTIPDRSTIVQFADAPTRSRPVARGVFRPVGRKDAVVISDGVRKSPEGVLSLLTLTDGQRWALEDLLEDSAVLLLNIPLTKPWGLNPCYVSLGDLDEVRPSRTLVEPARQWSLPYAVTEAPSGGMLPQWNLGDVAATYTLAQAAALTLQQVLLGPNP